MLAILVIGGLLLAAAAPLRSQEPDPGPWTEIESRCRALLDQAPVPGLAVGVVSGGRLAYAAGFGVADRESRRPATPATLFQVGSMSKPFTGTLLGILRERGLLAMDDRIERHLPPDLASPTTADGAGITIRQLATHTSGLPRQPPTLRRADDDAPVLAFTHFELYRSLERARLDSRPGERFQYSNFGFAVLGHILERASGLPYETLLVRELLEPLGMASSTVTLWPALGERLAVPYYPTGTAEGLVEYTPWDTGALAPASGLASTVEDLARFAAFHLAAYAPAGPGAAAGGGPGAAPDAVLSAEGRRLLHEPRWRVSDGTSYGLGWLVREVEGLGRVVGHGGEVDGYTSHLALAPESGHAVILLANAGDAPLTELGDWILRRVAGR